MIDSDVNMYLTVDSIVKLNNINIVSNNIALRKYGIGKMYMDKDVIEDKFYRIIDQFNESKITAAKFYSILLNKIHAFYDGNGRSCKILCANDDKIIKLVIRTKKIKN